jgi:hypothetical protein
MEPVQIQSISCNTRVTVTADAVTQAQAGPEVDQMEFMFTVLTQKDLLLMQPEL